MGVADVWVATLAAAFLSGFVPLVNSEAYLLGAAALLPGAPPGADAVTSARRRRRVASHSRTASGRRPSR